MGPYASLRNDLRSVPALALVAAISILTGCGGGGSSTPAAPVAVTVAGNNQVRLGTTAQFTAAVTNTSNSAVNWQVNGVTGGAAATGTISTTGLYTPPAAIPAPNTVTITAVSQASPSSSGSMSEAILNPIPTITAATVAGLGAELYHYGHRRRLRHGSPGAAAGPDNRRYRHLSHTANLHRQSHARAGHQYHPRQRHQSRSRHRDLLARQCTGHYSGSCHHRCSPPRSDHLRPNAHRHPARRIRRHRRLSQRAIRRAAHHPRAYRCHASHRMHQQPRPLRCSPSGGRPPSPRPINSASASPSHSPRCSSSPPTPSTPAP